MALPQYPSSRISDVQLPIVLLPDVREEDMESVAEFVTQSRPQLGEPPRSPAVPQHPIPSMQRAFAESLFESTQGDAAAVKPKLRTGDARARRSELIDQARADPPPTALWRCRPGQHTHELARLVAQMSFGVHLLLRGMATSHTLVVSILQGHIDEVDEFLETTLEDMDLATADMEERIEALKIPMDNVEHFERMLEGRNYRMEILDGNQQIEHILARTQVALQQTNRDLAEGLAATREFTIYLAEQHHGSWRQDCPDVIDIFDAMKGNTDGWFNAFMELQGKSSSLNALMVQVTGMVSEMERRAGEVSRRTRFSVRPYTSPGHSPQPSDASSITTPPTSPPRNVTSSPPRLSLRLSTIETVEFSIHLETQAALGEEAGGRARQLSRDGTTPRSLLMVTSRSPPPESPTESSAETPTDTSTDTPTDTPVESPTETPTETPAGLPPQAPPARNPRRLSKRPSMLLEVPEVETPKESEEDETAADYMLLPRIYTPQLPSPQPSPRVTSPPQPEPEMAARRPRVESSASWGSSSSVESAAQVTVEFARPRVEMVAAKPQAFRPRMVEIAGKTDPRLTPKLVQRPNPRPVSRPDPGQAPELVIPQDPEVHGTQRTSLRQRISLKTNPPESIQVPPPQALDGQRRLHAVPRPYPAPDSAYGSDMDRAAVHSMASINSSVLEFSPPFIQPGMIPSPHSERQFFRPVQASPHSPLQQRPHTSGTIGPHHFPAPPRNTPSAMGMSMMSSSTAMTNKSGGGKTVKKKRSAFNWLKKAFALDEEERAAFEQRKRDQAANPYYEAKSQEFLDGRRIRPRPPY
ncbi:hypothetical protein C8A05DRAFT_40311 [Staphylotrichum tortipilum]|uniref:Uncharacterized protein n=1 Tax=Staphylotrichum tortipilum TaxID=2831512 RepID=A0AAN6MW37_9PEZI|nr:hypothetical protein C8A05DRAFT_40311 [Staphylotrichum longicolle]